MKRDLQFDDKVVDLFATEFGMRIIPFDSIDDEVIGDYYEVNDSYYIYSKKGVNVRRSIRGEIREEVIEYHLYGVTCTPATHFEPEEYDECYLSIEKSLTDAFKKILLIKYEEKLNCQIFSFDLTSEENVL